MDHLFGYTDSVEINCANLDASMQPLAPAPSFQTDIKPLFRAKDIHCMAGQGVLLDDYAYMSNPSTDETYADHANARNVYARLTGDDTPRMPMGGPYWSDTMLTSFKSWMDGGFQP